MALDTVVIGAGHAGLGVASFLKRDGRDFVVLERGRVGETWRTQRWDSFRVNTPNWMNHLPGEEPDGEERDGFRHRDDLVAAFERYAWAQALPVHTGVEVTAVARSDDGRSFVVRGMTSAGEGVAWASPTVVVASGMQRVPRLPTFRRRLPPGVLQLHSTWYRSSAALPRGAVVVVEAGQSGCQIAEDLLDAGRDVYLSASRVARVPRRYRGRDILEWWAEAKLLDETPAELEDPRMRFAAQPQVSGLGRFGHTVSLQYLARRGAQLLGRVTGASRGSLVLDGRLGECVRFGDERSAKLRGDIDAFIERAGISAPPAEEDPADAPAPHLWAERGPGRLDLARAGVTSVVWCTGVTGEFGWLRLPALDARGEPLHAEGVSGEEGLFFVGFPWLRTRKSGIIYGIHDDGARIAEAVGRHLGS